MTKIIIHGGFTRVKNDLNDSFWAEIGKSAPEGGTVLLCYFANEEETQKRYEGHINQILEQTEGKTLHFELAQKDNFIEQVKKADVLYINGGDTAHLFGTLQSYPDFLESIKGKTVAGSSAGAQIFSTFYFSSSKESIREGFGLLPIRLVCHYGSDKFPIQSDPLALMEQYPSDLELVILRDYEWKVFKI